MKITLFPLVLLESLIHSFYLCPVLGSINISITLVLVEGVFMCVCLYEWIPVRQTMCVKQTNRFIIRILKILHN